MALPGVASIFTAEVQAIKLALKRTHEESSIKYLVVSDSLSVLTAIQSPTIRNHIVQRIHIKISRIISTRKSITFLWIPGHSGVKGNDRADQAAKQSAGQSPQFITVPYTDWYSYIRETTYTRWTPQWEESSALLRRIKRKPGKWKKVRMARREEVVVTG